MSRIGRKPIQITNGVSVGLDDRKVTVRGPRGELAYILPTTVNLQIENSTIKVENVGAERDKQARALFGTVRAILQNMVTGVDQGFRRELEIRGVGYRGQCNGQRLMLSIGFSHQVEFHAPEEVSISMPENNRIVVEGIDKQVVGETAAKIRSFRPPDSYKGKGIRYAGEEVALKEGKTVG